MISLPNPGLLGSLKNIDLLKQGECAKSGIHWMAYLHGWVTCTTLYLE